MNAGDDAFFFGDDPHATADRLEKLAHDLRRLAAGPPTEEDLRDAPLIRTNGPVMRPVLCLSGQIFGHPAIGHGNFSITSELFAIADDESWARTVSRFYRLRPLQEGDN